MSDANTKWEYTMFQKYVLPVSVSNYKYSNYKIY